MVRLGDKVRDPITGFEGVAVSSHYYLHGCARISVQPPVDKEGKLPEIQSFDEPQLEIVQLQVAKGDPVLPGGRPGGPDKYEDTERR
tara:strand:- start:810 stop:1070 length:261 start_codon:yes stop_codon:yes gene_type:complete